MCSSRGEFELHENVCPRAGIVRMTSCLVGSLLLGMLCGCESSDRGTMANSYYLNSHEDLRELGRVTLVELDNMSHFPTISDDMTRALFLELQKKQVFSVATVARDDPAWQPLQENLDSLQAMQALLLTRERLKCNGLLVGAITEYRPYPRLAIGLRLKLLDLTNGQVLWGVEQVWDSTDRNVQKRVQAYSRRELRSGSSPLPEHLVGVSSLEFAKFVAYEVAQTLDAKKR